LFFYEDRCRQTRKCDPKASEISIPYRTYTVVYTLCCFPFHGLQHTKDKITALLLLGAKYDKQRIRGIYDNALYKSTFTLHYITNNKQEFCTI